MDPNVKSRIMTLAVAFGSILTAIAMHGKSALDALGGVPLLLQAWASGLPLGVWSFALALIIGVLLWLGLAHKRPALPCGKSRSFSNDTMTLCACIVVTLSEQWSAGLGPRGVVLNALWLGIVSGLLAPYVGRGLRAVFTKSAPQ